MSTDSNTGLPEVPDSRPTMEELTDDTPFMERLIASTRSVRQALALAGSLTFAIGVLIWIFFRDLATSSYILMILGIVILLIDGVISFDTVRYAIFGRRGRYGLNTAIILIAFVGIGVMVNYLLFWASDRPNPAGWLRIDTTATKQFIVSDATLNALSNLREPIHVIAFFRGNTPQRVAAARKTEDLLSEFRRRSSVHDFSFEFVDPELQPNIATEYDIDHFPSIAIEAVESRRTEVIRGLNPNTGPDVISEQDIITGLLVVNQLKQKSVMFISGHSGRDITDSSVGESGYGLATEALLRENYLVGNGTLQELGGLLSSGDPEQFPAAVVIPGPTSEMTDGEEFVLLEYARSGGSILMLMEPDTVPDTFKGFLSRYGVAVGEGTVVDTASFVAPNPRFLQVKNSNGQLPDHPLTRDFDVLYLPGSTHFSFGIDPASIPITDDGIQYVNLTPVAVSTLSSWAESDEESINFDAGIDAQGPLPVVMYVDAIAEISGGPRRDQEGNILNTQMVLIGDTDFASNAYFGSARNGDLFINAINYLAEDYELITLRPKQSSFRELVLTESERDFIRWSGWLLMPALVALAGVWVWWRRR